MTPPPILGQDDLLECLRWAAFKMCRRGEHEDFASDAITMAIAHIEALEAENERLNSLINDTANHWLRLQCDHPVGWVGAIDTAMEAACDEIRRLSAALGDEQ